MPDRLDHDWERSVRNGQPAMVCRNAPCPIVWWPDRQQPRSTCTGRPYVEIAAEAVRALVVGGDA